MLTQEGYEELKTNQKFINFEANENYDLSQYSKKVWWRPQELKNSISKKHDFPNGSLLTFSIGIEESKHLVYVSYHTM